MRQITASLLLTLLLPYSSSSWAQSPSGRDVELIVCTYAEAIAANPRMVSAYHNIVKELIENPADGAGAYVPGRTKQCLQETGLLPNVDEERVLFSSYIEDMLDSIERRFGSSTMLDFNRIALRWTYQNFDPMHNDAYDPLIDIIERDASIPGAHALLGIYWQLHADYPKAIASFSSAADLQPNEYRFEFNRAQALALNGDVAAATESYRRTLELNPGAHEARLSQAALALKTLNNGVAEDQLAQIPEDASGLFRLRGVADYMRAISAFRSGDTASAYTHVIRANENLEFSVNSFSTYFHFMVAATLEEVIGQPGEWTEGWNLNKSYPANWPDLRNGNDPITEAWFGLFDRCSQESIPAEWGNGNDCLPQSPDARMHVLFDHFLDFVFERLYFRDIPFVAGKACPFLFSLHEPTGQWLFESTIITGLDGKEKEAEQRQRLEYFTGTIQLRELEHEISYIDRIVIEAVDQQGRTHTLYPQAALSNLHKVDDEKLVLHRDDEVTINFADYDPDMSYQEVYVLATGYYDPLGLP